MPSSGADLARLLLDHFDAHRRAMPWRETSDPYAIWVSEVMLQQTRVDTVIPYYRRWLGRFPTLRDLAEAELDDVLKEWEGLGYYSRARNLHRAARMVRERHDGVVPGEPETLRELPGIGEYTAGAVASIAFGARVPAVDGNVRRVLARLHDLEAPGPAELRRRAAALVPAERPGDFNQALMELGATVCTPRSPDCGACPWADHCRARRLGVQEQRPRPPGKKRIPEEFVHTVMLLRFGGAGGNGEGGGRGGLEDPRVLLVRRPEDGLLGGLWEFPGIGASPAVRDLVAAGERVATLSPVRHTFSHKRVEYRPQVLRLDGRAGRDPAPVGGAAGDDQGTETGTETPPGPEARRADLAWVEPRAVRGYALPVAQQKLAALLLEWLEGRPH